MKAKLTLNNLRCSVSGVQDEDFKNLRRFLSYEQDFFAKKNSDFGDGFIYLMTPKGTFLLGLADDVHHWLINAGYKVEVIDKRTDVCRPSSKEIKSTIKMLPFKPRPYQLDMVLRACVKRHGIIHAATGAGKTFIMAAIIETWNRPTVIIVNNTDLMYQLQYEISEYLGYDLNEIGIVGNSRYEPKNITIAMVQTLTNSRIGEAKRKIVDSLLKGCEVLCCDEVHHAQATTYKKAIRACSNAVARFGFSATPTTTENEDFSGNTTNSDIVLKAYFGPVLGRVTTRNLIEDGYLAEPVVVMVENFVYSDGVHLDYALEYDRIISKDDDRNTLIAQIIYNHWVLGEQIIGFVTRIEHGEEVARILEDRFGISADEIGYVTGELDVRTRASHIKDFKDGSIPILLGTVLSEGLNFLPDVGINISGGKQSKIAIQRIGRILRKKRDPELNDVNVNEHRRVIYYDFKDLGHQIFQKHSRKRESVYKLEGHKTVSISEADAAEKPYAK